MSAQKLVEFDPKPAGFDPSVGSFLRRVHPHKTAEHVAQAIGVPPETARQWLRGVARPNFGATLALVGVYGPELLAAALPRAPEWLARALNAERRRAAMDALHRAQERLGELHDADELGGRPTARLGGALGAGLCDRGLGAGDRAARVAGREGM